MALDSKQLRYFLEVGTLGSIKAASETLHITQSALSRRMVNLETDIGKPLFIRSHTGVELTEVGRELMVRGIELMSLLDQIGQIGQIPPKAGSSKTIHVGMVASASSLLLEKVLVGLSHSDPNILLRVEGTTNQSLTALGLQIKVGPIEKENPAIESIPLWRETLLLVAPKGASLRDIRKMTYVEAAKSPEIRATGARILAEMGIEPKHRIEVWPSSEAMRVIDNNAYAILPYTLLAAHNRFESFKIIPSRYERFTMALSLLKSASKGQDYQNLKKAIIDVSNEFLKNDTSGFLWAP
nr:LysR family transcriptional regulator [uncultured Cohaesibacter sp.]